MRILWSFFLLLSASSLLEGKVLPNRRIKRNVEDLVNALLKRVEAIMFYTPNPSGELEEFYVSAIQVAAKYHLEYNIRLNIIIMAIRETAELEDIISQHPGGNDEDFAAGIIEWANNYKQKFEDLGISAVNALGKINALAFDPDFRDSNTDQRKDIIREILNSNAVRGADNLRLGDDE